uniref:ATP synthase F0 subunit 8 n=1 Tax=Scelimena sp. 1 XDL-2023a TaxID=3071528 RepID=A0AA50RPD1_9ORTH|nr:ATP synthase F0 subunit 8 [Scelimena sp. 1 XDL-2023a]
MPQMSNMWWLPLAVYFSVTLMIMNTMIFSIKSVITSKKNLSMKKNNPLIWKW